MLSNRVRTGLVEMLIVIAGVWLACTGCGEMRTESPAVVPLHGAADADVIPDQYIIVLPQTASERVMREIQQQTEALGGTILHTYRPALDGFAAWMPPEALTALRQDKRIRYIAADRRIHSTGVQTCPPSWGLDRIDQASLPLNGVYTYPDVGVAESVNVYVLDTGIDGTHEEFMNAGNSRVTCGMCTIPNNSKCDTEHPVCALETLWTDDHGHGTHLAGIIGGKTAGVAKTVSLYAVKVSRCMPSGKACASDAECCSGHCTAGVCVATADCQSASGNLTDAIAGVNWILVKHQENVLHGSTLAVAVMGFGIGVGDYYSLTHPIHQAIKNGIVFVAGAGNNNDDACKYAPGGYYDPDLNGKFYGNQIITVGALDHEDNRWSSSNYGECLDIFAPGADVVSAIPSKANCSQGIGGFASMSGTSQAAAYTAGVVAFWWQVHPSESVAEVTAKIIKGSDIGANPTLGAESPHRALYYASSITGSPNDHGPNGGSIIDEDECDDRVACSETQCNFCPDPSLNFNYDPSERKCCADFNCGDGLWCEDGTCQRCGAEGTRCCAGNVCGPSLVCDTKMACSCGKVGQPCCDDGTGSNSCDPPYACDGGQCGGCGFAGMPCCNGDCKESDVKSVCVSGKCEPCGVVGMPCCNSACQPGSSYCVQGKCEPCGGIDEVCCPPQECASELSCYNDDGVFLCDGRSCAVVCKDNFRNVSTQADKDACNAWADGECVGHIGRLRVRYDGKRIYCESGCWARCGGGNWVKMTWGANYDECVVAGQMFCVASYKGTIFCP